MCIAIISKAVSYDREWLVDLLDSLLIIIWMFVYHN